MSLTKYLHLILIIFSTNTLTQEIDPSLLNQLSQEQISQVKDAVSGNSSTERTISGPIVVDESLVPSITSDSNKIEGKKFGYDFFSQMPTSLIAVGDLPLPNDYKISLRDQLRVILSGSKDSIFDLSVRLDGTILFPELGSISVVGLTFKEVKDKLSQKISESYIGVNIDVTIKDLSAKKITIVGAVKTPGTYLVNPFSTITSALAYSGGISEIGSLRQIKLIRTNGDTFLFDLYDLLIKGNRSNDLNIQAGDTILITPANHFVRIDGAVKRPGIYELLENETIQDVIDFSLGFGKTANKTNISISVLDLDSASIITKNTNNLDQSVENILDINIFRYVNKAKSSIRVFGAIEEPGFYSLDKFSSLSELVDALEFVDAYPWLAVLEQFDDKDLIKSSLLFSLKDRDTYKDVILLPNSRVYFADKDLRSFDVNENSSYLINQYALSIEHKQASLVLPMIGKFSVKELINFLGLDMDGVESEVTYVSPFKEIIISEDYETLELDSQVDNFLRFRSKTKDLINVTISGAVEFPGVYTLKPNSTIQDVYDLVGGFKQQAFLDGVIFTREAVRNDQEMAIERSTRILEESVLAAIQNDGIQNTNLLMLASRAQDIDPRFLGRISGNFQPESFGALNTILFTGDDIFIPRSPSTINVYGEVLNPISFQFEENINLRDALSKAGGLQKYADQSRIYVIKANGEVSKSRRNIFMNNFELQPGDTIIVPRRFISSNPVLKNLTPVTQILSDIAFSAAAIESLSNN